MIKLIKQGDVTLAKVIIASIWDDNLTFYTENSDFIQVATWNYNTGKHLKAHGHKICNRESNRTQEVLFIRKGKVEAIIYDEQDQIVERIVLSEGDILMAMNGGHAYNILEDGTQVLEVKNGPYPGIDLDKKVIEQ